MVDADTNVMLASAVSRRLGVSVSAVRQWADRGQLPSMRTAGAAGTRLFRTADVEELARKLAQLRALKDALARAS